MVGPLGVLALMALAAAAPQAKATAAPKAVEPSCCEGGLAAACTGAASCRACTNCSRCAHCKSGGTCGVCAVYQAPMPAPRQPSRPSAEAEAERRRDRQDQAERDRAAEESRARRREDEIRREAEAREAERKAAITEAERAKLRRAAEEALGLKARERADERLDTAQALERAGNTKGALADYREAATLVPAGEQGERAAARLLALVPPPRIANWLDYGATSDELASLLARADLLYPEDAPAILKLAGEAAGSIRASGGIASAVEVLRGSLAWYPAGIPRPEGLTFAAFSSTYRDARAGGASSKAALEAMRDGVRAKATAELDRASAELERAAPRKAKR